MIRSIKYDDELWLSDDIMLESHHVSNHTEPHPGYTRGISVEQTSLNGLSASPLLSYHNGRSRVVDHMREFLGGFEAISVLSTSNRAKYVGSSGFLTTDLVLETSKSHWCPNYFYLWLRRVLASPRRMLRIWMTGN